MTWLRLCEEPDGDFEALRASATPESAPVFESCGFVEIDDPDLTALARGEPIATHAASLPAALEAYEARAGADTADRLLDMLRRHDEKRRAASGGLRRPSDETTTSASEEETKPADDPWAGLGRTFF
mmetsp:Transcript_18781/g.74962  ORF Transcript_18781/g.74962 Transcript_18781/m.74962 type:complete len:127 (-) Transcript_18781:118-498(-)